MWNDSSHVSLDLRPPEGVLMWQTTVCLEDQWAASVLPFLLGGQSRDLLACQVKKLELGFRLEITLRTRTCPTVVLWHFLIPRERPINKADKSGAVQIKLGGEPRAPTCSAQRHSEAWKRLGGTPKGWEAQAESYCPVNDRVGNPTLGFIVRHSFCRSLESWWGR